MRPRQTNESEDTAEDRSRGFFDKFLPAKRALRLRGISSSPYKDPALVFGPGRFLALFLLALGMAYVEATCVVYLWKIFYWPEGFSFPLLLFAEVKEMGNEWVLAAEVARESATLVMLLGCAMAVGRTGVQKVASFLFLFGAWDILYYVWLRVISELTAFAAFPASLGTWDILFLIPVPWTGPVYAPMIVAATMILFSVMLILAERRGARIKPDLRFWIIEAVAVLMIFASFIWNCGEVLGGRAPFFYPWWFLFVAEIVAITAFVYVIRDCFYGEA
jgi:hypothetical protein